MRKLFPLLSVAVVLSIVSLAVAAEEKTYTGDAVCAKCALKETPQCQSTLKVDGTTYYLEGEASEAAHKKLGICKATKDAPVKVKVTGTESEKDGKKVIQVTKIEKAD